MSSVYQRYYPGMYSVGKHKANKMHFGGNREKVIKRDDYRCLVCGISRFKHWRSFGIDLTVDHIKGDGVYDVNNIVPNNELYNLQTLCRSCHGRKDAVRKLSDVDIINIYHIGEEIPSRKLARMYGVTQKTILLIRHKRIWSNLWKGESNG